MPPKSKPTSSHSSTRSYSKPSSSHSSSRRSTSSHSSHHFTTNNLSYKPDRYSSGLTTGLLIGSMLNNTSASESRSEPKPKPEPKYIEKICPFCDSHLKVNPITTTCPNCGGDLGYTVNNSVKNSAKTEETVNNSVNIVNNLSTTTQLIIGLFAIFITAFITVVFIVPYGSRALRYMDENPIVFNTTNNNKTYNNETYNNETYTNDDDYIYVEPLERNVYWSDEYDCYYDELTDCYFFKNTDLEPEIWQYWFEDVSSDYGDYGWMEYDFDENCWYIQTDDETWEKYIGSTDGLWHMNENE